MKMRSILGALVLVSLAVVPVWAAEMTPEEIKKMVIDGHSSIEIRAKAIEQGMVTLRRAALLNALRGNTTIDEVLRVTLAEQRAVRSTNAEPAA